MKRRFLAVAAVCLLAGGSLAAQNLSLTLPAALTVTITQTPTEHCATEDSQGPCIWDADVDGNGHGRSFIVTDTQRVIYQ